MPLDVAGSLHAPVLGLYGGKDESIPLDDVRAMESTPAVGRRARPGIAHRGCIRRRACLPDRLPPQLPRRRCAGRLAAHAGLVRAVPVMAGLPCSAVLSRQRRAGGLAGVRRGAPAADTPMRPPCEELMPLGTAQDVQGRARRLGGIDLGLTYRSAYRRLTHRRKNAFRFASQRALGRSFR